MLCFDNIQLKFSNMGLFRTTDPWIHPKRVIDSYEIICVLNGEFTLVEGNVSYNLKPNDILFLSPGVIHYGLEKTNCKIKFFWLHFHCNSFDDLKLKKYYNNEKNNNLYLFQELMHLQQSASNRTLPTLKLAELLLKLQNDSQDSETKLISEIKEYIRVNADKQLTVQSISETFGYNKDYLSKTFSKNIGIPLQKYIIRERIRHIKTYLLNTNFPIKHIAAVCNFEDENALIKFFKYNTSTTPTKYRNSHNNLHMNKR